MSLRVRPIRYTAHPAPWVALVTALGAEQVLDEGDWQLFALAGGGVAIHAMPDGDPSVGSTQLRFVVADLDAALRAAAAALDGLGLSPSVTTEDFGRYATIAAADGQHVYLDENSDLTGRTALAAAAPAEVLPLWYTGDVPGGVRALTALGLEERIRSDSGEWVDLRAPGGGLFAVHGAGSVGAVLSFEHPDVRALAERVNDAGIVADVVDENYGLSLQIANPDSPDDLRTRIWVNQTQKDLYGYRRLG
ncbi:hypothetical protein EXU48_17400 [Occultella glacieicola]|uniref:VOC domain-containing protein n=1 Tax=Occultella glacieicola TaxID=2518684 RepID=A0ABY2E0E1_9MICO|nr:hypothetical protein [Occultella glacieicola]TDE90876.1 hypothetical protein EXU48_17400 [Occultella glacieicola]